MTDAEFVTKLKEELGLDSEPGTLLAYEIVYGEEPIREAANRILEREAEK